MFRVRLAVVPFTMATVIPSNATFLAFVPQFMGVAAGLVTEMLTRAARRTNPKIFASLELAEQHVMLLAAELLLCSPAGQAMRAASPDQAFAWAYERRQLQRSATMGVRVFS